MSGLLSPCPLCQCHVSILRTSGGSECPSLGIQCQSIILIVQDLLDQEALSSFPSKMVCKDLESDPADLLSIAFRDGKSSSGEVSILHKEGYRIPIVLRTIPIQNIKSAVIGAAECFERNFSVFER